MSVIDAWMRWDRWVVEHVAEPAAWFLERHLGFTATVLARPLVMVWVAGLIAEAFSFRVLDCILAGGALAVTPVRLWTISEIENAIGRAGTANPEKHQGFLAGIRIIILAGVPGNIYQLATGSAGPAVVGIICCLVHFYLCACDRPPPAPVRVPDAVPAGA